MLSNTHLATLAGGSFWVLTDLRTDEGTLMLRGNRSHHLLVALLLLGLFNISSRIDGYHCLLVHSFARSFAGSLAPPDIIHWSSTPTRPSCHDAFAASVQKVRPCVVDLPDRLGLVCPSRSSCGRRRQRRMWEPAHC